MHEWNVDRSLAPRMHIAEFGSACSVPIGSSQLNDVLTIAEAGLQFLLSQSRPNFLERAIEAVRRLPADAQNDIARTILHPAGSEVEAEPVDPAHLAAMLEGLAQAKRREFATNNEVEAGFHRFRHRRF